MLPNKIAVVSIHDTENVKHWSGTPFYMYKALKKHSSSLVEVRSEQKIRLLYNKLLNKGSQAIFNRPLPVERSVSMAQKFASDIEQKLQHTEHDVLFSIGSIQAAYLRSEKPVVVFADSLYGSLRRTYPELMGYSDADIAEGEEIEKKALASCAKLILTSGFAKEEAIAYYDIPEEKIEVVPFGANLDTIPDALQTRGLIEKRNGSSLKLLFVGVAWERKGGPLAIEILNRITQEGVDVTLQIIGCVPPDSVLHDERVKVIPFLNKSIEKEQRVFDQLLSQSHFLLLPSVAECFGIAHIEASAFGVPSIALDVGGVSEVVKHNESGLLFKEGTSAEEIASNVVTLWKDKARYQQFAYTASNLVRERLNWDVAACHILDILEKAIEGEKFNRRTRSRDSLNYG